jgi:molybdopterin biosynthesis enzyme
MGGTVFGFDMRTHSFIAPGYTFSAMWAGMAFAHPSLGKAMLRAMGSVITGHGI